MFEVRRIKNRVNENLQCLEFETSRTTGSNWSLSSFFFTIPISDSESPNIQSGCIFFFQFECKVQVHGNGPCSTKGSAVPTVMASKKSIRARERVCVIHVAPPLPLDESHQHQGIHPSLPGTCLTFRHRGFDRYARTALTFTKFMIILIRRVFPVSLLTPRLMDALPLHYDERHVLGG